MRTTWADERRTCFRRRIAGGYYTLAEDMRLGDTQAFDLPLRGPAFAAKDSGKLVLGTVLNEWRSVNGEPWSAQLEVAAEPRAPTDFMICWNVRSPKVLRTSCNTFEQSTGLQVGSYVVDDSDVSGFGGARGRVVYRTIPGFTWSTAADVLGFRLHWLSQ